MNVHPELLPTIERFELPGELGFGQTLAPIMYRLDFRDGAWDESQLLPYADISIDPAAKVLHFAQVVFEGLKAYRADHAQIKLFRPHMNAARFKRSCTRMLMPELPESRFIEGVSAVSAGLAPLVPGLPGQSLYLRPLMFGTQSSLGLAPSDRFIFLVIASPSDALITGPLRVVVEREATRASKGGTGNVKASGNYGASLQSSMAAMERGFDQPLWLDAREQKYIEELSAMNFFAVIDGALHTPGTDGTILPGVTRDSVITLAGALGIPVRAGKIAIDALLQQIRTGRCTEAFACGTAAVIAPISVISERDGAVYELPEASGAVANRLRDELLAIQEGRAPDRFNWMYTADMQCH